MQVICRWLTCRWLDKVNEKVNFINVHDQLQSIQEEIYRIQEEMSIWEHGRDLFGMSSSWTRREVNERYAVYHHLDATNKMLNIRINILLKEQRAISFRAKHRLLIQVLFQLPADIVYLIKQILN
jgi:hypothetical protein